MTEITKRLGGNHPMNLIFGDLLASLYDADVYPKISAIVKIA